jgi:hypothetical protein
VGAVVKVHDKDLRETAAADVSLVTVQNGKTNLLGKAVYDSATRSYQAQIRLAQPAQAVVSAVATLKGAALGDDRQLLVCEALDVEAADLRARPELMRDLARISGGKAVSISEPDPSFARSVFYNAPPVTIDYRRTPIWDRAWWLCAVLGLLTTEWAVRRLKGLA